MRFRIGFIGLMLAVLGLTGSLRAFKSVQAALSNPNTSQIIQANIPQGAVRINEQESNNTLATANPIMASRAIIRGIIWSGDVDMYRIELAAGDRLNVATMTSASTHSSTDTVLSLYAPDGTSLIELDDDDGVFGNLSSVISSVPVTVTGTYYIRINAFLATAQVRYYDLYVRIFSEATTAEQEPNDVVGTAQVLPASGAVEGSLSATTDVDLFQLSLNAGDTIFTSIDFNPERDSTNWNGSLGIGLFNGLILLADDNSTSAPPNAEAHFMTVKNSGTYYVVVSTSASSIPAEATYLLNVTVFPAEQQANCTTYASTDVAKTIPTTTSFITSTLSVPDNFIIADLDVSIQLTHNNMPDLDVQLQGPDGNVGGLFTDIGSNLVTMMDLDLDDEAGITINSFAAVAGMKYIPESVYRLNWFDGGRSAGTWTLLIHDDLASNGGTLQNWSITLCAAPPASCPDGMSMNTITSTDFEANNGGFTHNGIGDTWEYGAPIAEPLIGSYSGVNSWKTNLDGTYSASSVADLFSPSISIPNVAGPVYLQWYQRYQMDTAGSDRYSASIGAGAVTKTLYEFESAVMTNPVGNPSVTFQESTVWSRQLHEISEFKGQSVRVQYHLDSNATTNLGGVAIDDFQIMTCDEVIATATSTPTNTPTPTPTNTPTNTPTPTPTETPTNTPTVTVTPSNTPTLTPSATAGPTTIPVYLPLVVRGE